MKEKTEKKRQRTYLKIKTFLTWDRIQTSRSRKHNASNKMNPKSSTPRHIVIKMTKIEDKQRNLGTSLVVQLRICLPKQRTQVLIPGLGRSHMQQSN